MKKVSEEDFLLSGGELSLVKNNLNKYLDSLCELKMYYIIFAINIESISLNCLDSNKMPEDEDLHIVFRNSQYLKMFISVYFNSVLNQLNKKFIFELELYNTSDIRYILLNMLNYRNYLVCLVESGIFPDYGEKVVLSLMNNKLPIIDVSIESKKITNELLKGVVYSRYFRLSEFNLDNLKCNYEQSKINLELFELSKNFINSFNIKYEKLLLSSDKFLFIQKLVFVYKVIYCLDSIECEVSDIDLINFLCLFQSSCIFISGWLKNPLLFFKSNEDLPIKMLLEIYGSSEFFMNCYNQVLNSSMHKIDNFKEEVLKLINELSD